MRFKRGCATEVELGALASKDCSVANRPQTVDLWPIPDAAGGSPRSPQQTMSKWPLRAIPTRPIMTSQGDDIPAWASREACDLLDQLCAKGEGQETEFKEQLPQHVQDIGRTMAAFATSNRGYLVFGVADDGKVTGLPDAADMEGRDRFMQRIAGIAKHVRPPPLISGAWATSHGRPVYIVTVEKGSEPLYYSSERPILRQLNTSRPAEPAEVEHIFRTRYATGPNVSALPSTKQIASRLQRALKLMNASRDDDSLTVADLARAMDLPSPADLDAVFVGRTHPTFAILDSFCERFAVNKEWLLSGRSSPFASTADFHSEPHDYKDWIDQAAPEYVYAVRSNSVYGEAYFVIQMDAFKHFILPMSWHVSRHVGGTGAHQLLSLYKLFKDWIGETRNYMILGRSIEARLATSIADGETHAGVVAHMPNSHWWDDLTDLGHKWTSRESASREYGEGFVDAQDIIRAQLERKLP